MKLIFDYQSREGGMQITDSGVESAKDLPEWLKRDKIFSMPTLSESEVVRHFSLLAKKNFSVDANFYPLGSCTMKYNPKFTEKIAALDGFCNVHPFYGYLTKNTELTNGACEVLFELEKMLNEITGMDAFSLQPSAGAHGELAGAMIARAFHLKNGDVKRKKVIVPDSSHGTNPASAAMCGFEVLVVPSDENGLMDIDVYRELIDDTVALVMLTCPNTLGIFNPKIGSVCDLAHQNGALVYYDGANLNAILGKVRPGDVGFDIVHLNLHKTFATPHGGGGPGSGPVGVVKKLEEFLPTPRVIKKDNEFVLNNDEPLSIGQISAFYGNFLVALKAYAYILKQGSDGLNRVSDVAVLNANYIKQSIKDYLQPSHEGFCMHECVFTGVELLKYGVSALDIAKYLIDQGIHPPTMYFPLIVKEALMVEPTETESKETLDNFISVFLDAVTLAKENPEILKKSPVNAGSKRLDETAAARKPILRWEPEIND